MNIEEIYKKFDKIGCLTFATIDNGFPQTRIAHLFACDHEGLYFRTTFTKAFYEQLKTTQMLSICGIFPSTSTSHDEEGMPYFPPGYTISATGDIKEVPLKTIKEKAVANKDFMVCVKDIEKYPATVAFCLHSAWGEVFDFDFEMEHRSHKLLRTGFCFGGKQIPLRVLRITDECIACGECQEGCSFKAIDQVGEQFVIDTEKCDVCGDCYTVCPSNAIEIIITPPG